MKTTYALLITTTFFALLAMSFGYQNLYYNYLYWTCWDHCIVFEPSKCDEICNEPQPEPTTKSRVQYTIEQREKHDEFKKIYHPIIHTYANNLKEKGWVFSHGSSYSYPESIKDNLDVEFEYSDGILHYKQKLDIVSPISQTDNAGVISITKEIIFPELGVFLVFILGISAFVGFLIGKNRK